MAELKNVYSKNDLFTYMQYLRLDIAKRLNDQKINNTKKVEEENRTFKGTLLNFKNSIVRSVNKYDKKDNTISYDLDSLKSKHQSLLSRSDAISLSYSFFNDETNGLSKLIFACTIVLDNEYDYKYEDAGLREVSLVLYGNELELLIIKKQLEDNYNAISPTSLNKVQKGLLIGIAATSLAGIVCLPILLGGGIGVSAATTTAALAAHGFADMQIGLGMIAVESLLISAAIVGIGYGGMKLYNSNQAKAELKKLTPEQTALFLAIQLTHIQRLGATVGAKELKEQLDIILKNLNILKSDINYFLFIERESITENKNKIKTFHGFDNRLVKVLGL